MLYRTYTVALTTVCVLATLLVGARAGAGRALQSEAAPENRCEGYAYVIDTDPQGLNVRTGPGRRFSVAGRIPKGDAVGVFIKGSTGQWLLIEEAVNQGEGEIVYKGGGWVFGPMLATETRSEGYDGPKAVVKLFREPNTKSAVTGRLPPGTQVEITGCKGGWLRVRAGRLDGWLAPESQCANTLTNCA